MATYDECSLCTGLLTDSNAVRLWDGRDYCERCLEARLPGLADYARSHSRLEETSADEPGRVAMRLLAMEAGIFAIFFLVFLAGGASPAEAALVVGLLCFVQGGIQLPMFFWTSRRNKTTIVVENGTVTCRRRIMHIRETFELPLGDFNWTIGRPSRDMAQQHARLWPFGKVVLLKQRNASFWVRRAQIFACGWTEETKRVWVAFLQCAQDARHTVHSE